MRRRIPPKHPVAYLTVRPGLLKRPAWPGLLHGVRCELPGVELASYTATFASPQDYQARIGEVIGSSAGLVIITGPGSYVGRGIARKVRLAMAAQLPILVLARRGLVALADGRIGRVPEGERRPWRELRIVPPPSGAPSEATLTSLRAMGATRRRS